MIIVITGPTAVGKTKLSVEVAKKVNGEIINADSTQIYKELDIATAKVTKEEMQGIKHHLIDIKDIKEDYTLFNYQKDCRDKIKEILNKNKTPILTGGTGLYIKSALYDYDLREEDNLKEDFSSLNNEELYQKLLEIDPDTDIHKNNRKRVERAISYFYQHKELIKYNNKGNNLIYNNVIFIGLTTDRSILYERINKRVDEMIKNGLLEEAKKIYDLNVKTKAVLTPIGYKELFEYFDGIKSKEESIELIKTRSRRYAKKQYTWFNNKMNINWFEVDFDNFDNTIKEVLKFIGNKKETK